MEMTQNLSEWLDWWGRARFLVVTFVLGIVLAIHALTPLPLPGKYFVPLILLWYTLAVLYVILRRWIRPAQWHGPLQMAGDPGNPLVHEIRRTIVDPKKSGDSDN